RRARVDLPADERRPEPTRRRREARGAGCRRRQRRRHAQLGRPLDGRARRARRRLSVRRGDGDLHAVPDPGSGLHGDRDRDARPRVLAAMGHPIVYHYDPVFLARFRRTEERVKELFRTTNDVVLMQGEAILGLEAAPRALVTPGTKVLNLVQGVFGKGTGYWLK